MKKLSLEAYAKLNLTLDCLGKREDGYHELCSIMHPVSLCDIVAVERTEKSGIAVNCGNIKKEDNLVFKAAEAFFETSGIPHDDRGIEITVEKHIPILSGMGGGSTDGAAVINILDELYETRLSHRKKIGIAKSLGADVPFSLFSKTAVATGIGEKLEFIENFPQFYFVLVKPGQKGSTADMYKALDGRGVVNGEYTKKALSAIRSGDTAKGAGFFKNDFALCQEVDYISAIGASAEAFGALTTSITGSGPTCFSVFEDKNSCLGFFEHISKKFKNVFLAKSVG